MNAQERAKWQECSIISVENDSAVVEHETFLKAIESFNKKYTPSELVKITSIDHAETSYYPGRDTYRHTFVVHWEEPK